MFTVNGFLFENEEEAKAAEKEEEGVRYIKERIDFKNPEIVLKLYNKIVQQELFVTPVGLRFVMELQNFLLENASIDKESIEAIRIGKYISREIKAEKNVLETPKEKKNQGKPKKDYKQPFHIALFFSIVFAMSVIGMFVIMKISNNNVTIINYRNEIINEYENWESELKEKEKELKTWEKELKEKETGLQVTE